MTKLLYLLLSLLCISGCSKYKPVALPTFSNTIAKQVDTLFRRQNQASNQVMLLLTEETPSIEIDNLESAEQQMLEACKALNEYAVYERDNLKINLIHKNKIRASINHCEKKTKQLELLLKTYFSTL